MCFNTKIFGKITQITLLYFLIASCGSEANLDLSQPRLTAEQFTQAFIKQDFDLLKKLTMSESDIEYFCQQIGLPIAKFRQGEFGRELKKLEERFNQAYLDIGENDISKYRIETTDIEEEGWGTEYEFNLMLEPKGIKHFKLLLTKNPQGDWKLMGMR